VHSPHILVVDDDDAIRSVVVAVAQEAIPSAEVTSHASSLHALQKISTGEIDLLITNCHMPDMDGPTLIKTLRQEKNGIPIIMVSGSDEARELAEKAGVDRFVPKYAIHATLGDAILSLIER
jgi:CheY-like chemotaxis protein